MKKKKPTPPPIPTPTPAPIPALSIQAPSNKTVASSTGNPVAVAYATPTTSGGVAPVTLQYSAASGSSFPVGTTTVTVTATSSDGQTASCTFTVTVTWAAPTPPPPSTGLIQSGNLVYQGAFRAPQGVFGDPQGNGFAFGGGPIAFNPAGPSLFAGSLNGRQIAELSIPALVNSPVITDLHTGTVLQNFLDPTDDHFGSSTTGGTIPASIGGMLVLGSDLHMSGFIYYDANNTTTVSHFKRALNLSTPSFSGWQAVWQLGGQGFVGRDLAAVPSEWQTALGGSILASGWGLPIISRESYGPDAFAFDAAAVDGSQSVIAASALLYYPNEHPTLGDWSNTALANPVFNMGSDYGGLVIVPGWRSLLVFGRTGLGIPCYGEGTSNPALAGQPAPGGGIYCYDPASADKGTHAYPYAYWIWAYDLNDLTSVKAGTKQPWDVVPYANWELTLPIGSSLAKNLYATIDPATGTIYLSQIRVDPGSGSFSGPIFHAYTVA